MSDASAHGMFPARQFHCRSALYRSVNNTSTPLNQAQWWSFSSVRVYRWNTPAQLISGSLRITSETCGKCEAIQLRLPKSRATRSIRASWSLQMRLQDHLPIVKVHCLLKFYLHVTGAGEDLVTRGWCYRVWFGSKACSCRLFNSVHEQEGRMEKSGQNG